MRIGVPTESGADQRLVAATPKSIGNLLTLGYTVVVERGAGALASIDDHEYEAAGAQLADGSEVWASDLVITVDEPGINQIAQMTPGATVITRMAPDDSPELVAALVARNITALNLTAVPRISRAQALDVLSTMTNVAGYRGVIEAAQAYAGMFGGQVTAAGSTPPARVFVIGAGVAGLAALGAAGSLGASVRAYDVRAESAEQIESMGATFVRVDAAAQHSADGYATELTAEQLEATSRMYATESAAADIIITTALIRGVAPITITADMVAAMRPGSVIVDLAASGGGNCELTVPGERIVTPGGVTIIGYTDLPGRMPKHTSQLYGTNIVNLLKLMTPATDGELTLNFEDVIQRAITVTHEHEVLWPPPPISVSAAPAGSEVGVDSGAAGSVAGAGAGADSPSASTSGAGSPVLTGPAGAGLGAGTEGKASGGKKKSNLLLWSGISVAAVLAAITFSPALFAAHFTIFILAVVVGFYVITGVSHSLHTPLMAQTNAISGIILVGALLQIGSANIWVTALAFVAAAVASINIFGGFMVASRMLAMFRKDA